MARVYECLILDFAGNAVPLSSSSPFIIQQEKDEYFYIYNREGSIGLWVKGPSRIATKWREDG